MNDIILGIVILAIAWFIYCGLLVSYLRGFKENEDSEELSFYPAGLKENKNFSFRSLFSQSHEDCYHKCLAESYWDPRCASMCRI